MTKIFEDDFNPLDDLHTCMVAIEKQTEVMTQFVATINRLNAEAKQHHQLIRSLKNHIVALESRINAIEQASANSSTR